MDLVEPGEASSTSIGQSNCSAGAANGLNGRPVCITQGNLVFQSVVEANLRRRGKREGGAGQFWTANRWQRSGSKTGDFQGI